MRSNSLIEIRLHNQEVSMASQGRAIGIVAWILVAILLAGVGALVYMGKQQSGRVAGLNDALLQVGAAAGVEGLAPESLKDSAKLPDILQQIQTAVQGTRMELAGAKDALSAAQSEASGAKAEVQRVQAQAAKAEGLAKDLAAKDEAIAMAQAATEKAVQDAKAAQAAAEKQKTELEGNLASLTTRLAEETARLQAELDAARQAAVAAANAPASAEDPAAAMPEPPAAEGEGRIIGKSEMFSLIRYSAENQTLFFNLQDGQTLTYRAVPPEVYDQLVAAGDTMDMNYRFKIQGVYKSIPTDSIVVRKYWKRQRYKPALRDVRGIEPPATEAEEMPAAQSPAEEMPAEK
jgi:hypothetical protein